LKRKLLKNVYFFISFGKDELNKNYRANFLETFLNWA